MLKTNIDVKGLKELDKHIEFVNKMLRMKTDKDFQKFIQDKCMEALNKVMDQRLVGGTTNDMAIGKYRESNHIQETEDGFIIYNDCKIGADTKHPENYPNGEFSIALAFEYGVGIIGQNTDNPNAWEYNVNNYNFGWYFLPEDGDGQYHETAGYQGFEIYRYTAIEIQTNLNKWVEEYYSNEVSK